jgi:hypothetical protein
MLPYTEKEERTWKSFLVQNSRGRPRDAIQYISLLARIADERHYTKIPISIVQEASIQYSKERFEQIEREYVQDCSECGQIIREFAGEKFVFVPEELKELLGKLPSKFGITIRGITLHQGDSDHIFLLWQLLYEMGFLCARIPAVEEDAVKHIRYENDSRLIAKTNWNEMQALEWEIHPAYRSYLIDLREKTRNIGFNLFRKKR